jgi:hypothetical protein
MVHPYQIVPIKLIEKLWQTSPAASISLLFLSRLVYTTSLKLYVS